MKKSKRPVARRRAATAPASRAWWQPALLVVAAVFAYSNSLSGPLVFDDRGSIVDNPTIEKLWNASVLAAPRETPTAGRPLVNVSFALNYAVGGRDVTGFHLANIGIHIICALLIFAIGRRLMPSATLAWATALLWVVHPLTTEAVNYLTQRTELLMALFYLLTMYAALRSHELRSGRWAAAAVACCALGMMSKESMVTAPLAVMLIDRIFLFSSWREAFSARARLYAGLAATWIVLAALVASGPRSISAGFTAHDADVWTYLLNQTVMITRYVYLSLWPRPLALFYGAPLPLTIGDVALHAAFVLSLLTVTVLALWRAPRLGFLGAWFFLSLAPTSSIVPILTEVGAERRAYLALAAIVALIVLGVDWLAHRLAEPARTYSRRIAVAAAAVALVAGTIARNEDYTSSLRLAETTVAHWPTPGAHSMYGTELAAAGRLREAETHLRTAAPVYPPARYYLATVLATTDRSGEAIEEFKTYLAGEPPELDQAYQARGLLADALKKQGRLAEMEAELRTMLSLRPDDVNVMGQLAPVLVSAARYDEAVGLYRRMLRIRPDDVAALGGLGIALASTGQLEEAIIHFRRAAELDPQNARAQQNLARALAMRPK